MIADTSDDSIMLDDFRFFVDVERTEKVTV